MLYAIAMGQIITINGASNTCGVGYTRRFLTRITATVQDREIVTIEGQ